MDSYYEIGIKQFKLNYMFLKELLTYNYFNKNQVDVLVSDCKYAHTKDLTTKKQILLLFIFLFSENYKLM